MLPSQPKASARHSAWPAGLLVRHVALPSDHGSWIFLITPLLIGLALGGVRPASLLLVAALLAAFLIRQPVTLAVKVYAGRRPKRELPAVLFWSGVYALAALAAFAGLVALGDGYLAWLLLPALPVFAWYLALVMRRDERRQMLLEILASGVLALAAPAAFWVGQGRVSSTGWLLWGLAWLEVAGSILCAYLRLAQRVLNQPPAWRQAWAMGRLALYANLALLLLVLGLAFGLITPRWLPIAYLIQPLEVLWGMAHPAVGAKPTAIGVRQLFISLAFTLAFILAWRL